MRTLMLITVLAVTASAQAFAHCGKPHPDGKDKTSTSRPTSRPE